MNYFTQRHVIALRTAAYGTRRTPQRNATDAPDQTAAIGLGPRSVFDGPRVRRNGGPVVKRSRPG
jgi:hypothetical protein